MKSNKGVCIRLGLFGRLRLGLGLISSGSGSKNRAHSIPTSAEVDDDPFMIPEKQ